MVLWIVIGVVAVVLVWLVFTYNRLIRLRNESEQGYSSIDIQLKRRADLIPNLVETVKAYAAHERAVFDDVTEARARTLAAGSVGDAVTAEQQMRGALGRLFAVAEAYPQLRASENFQQLQEELSDTEDKIAAARRYYNNVVRRFNTAQQTLPTSLLAGPLGFRPREFFELEDEGDRAPARVEL
ncbi:MAG TPA: LemA family protein [Gaiellales bacterium]|nr:LemA family protein [Gaiellales bacterium]